MSNDGSSGMATRLQIRRTKVLWCDVGDVTIYAAGRSRARCSAKATSLAHTAVSRKGVYHHVWASEVDYAVFDSEALQVRCCCALGAAEVGKMSLPPLPRTPACPSKHPRNRHATLAGRRFFFDAKLLLVDTGGQHRALAQDSLFGAGSCHRMPVARLDA